MAYRSARTITVNGQQHHLDLDHRVTLLEVLREHLDLTGARIGNSHGLFHYPRRLCPPAACQPPPRARAPRQAAAGRAACRGHGQDDSLGTGRRRCLPGADSKR